MARGRNAPIGSERTSPNGYQYVKCKEGWVLKHKLVVEEHLGRKLEENERIRFIDGDRTNLDPENLKVYTVRDKSPKARIAEIDAKIDELMTERKELEAQC